jgi:hypothetical protein
MVHLQHLLGSLILAGTYKTSSWFEVSILRSIDRDTRHSLSNEDIERLIDLHHHHSLIIRLPEDLQVELNKLGWQLVERPKGQRDMQRDHCPEMSEGNEGCYAWYLQGNRVADETPAIYSVIWSKFKEPVIGPGAGDGKGFVEMLQPGDRILVWGRIKVNDRSNGLSQSIQWTFNTLHSASKMGKPCL